MENRRGLIALFLLVQLVIVLAPTCCIVRAQPTITGPIKTIVVLVMENRSFDHFVGLMKKLNPQIDGLNGNEYNLVNPSDPNSPRVQISDSAEFVDPDPGHEYDQVAEQIYGSSKTLTQPRMDGFVAQAESMMPGLAQRVMSAFRPEVVPVTTALAMNFALFDRYFSSVPSSTQPNRFFVHSATSHGLLGNDQTTLAKGLPQRTIFEDVDDAGLSFGVYYQQIPAMLFFNNLRKLKYVNKFKNYGTAFAIDAKLGILPNYVVIEQRYFDVLNSPANDDHPTHDVSQGQKLIKEVYETLRGSPQWNQMLFLITYDEHGGFYDHVPPPNSGVPNPDGVRGPPPSNFNYDRLGVRVPTIAISPWIEKGTGLSLSLSHTHTFSSVICLLQP